MTKPHSSKISVPTRFSRNRLAQACLASLIFCSLSSVTLLAQKAGDEITLPAETYKKLDTFEALNIEDADKLYNKKDYTGAYAAYKAYSFEFAQSKALPYVLLRMGRCLHQLEKRNAAIKAYQDVVDYFPDDVRYAAAALFYIGQCHGQNGDDAKKTAVWAKMVKDDDYVNQPNSGSALTYLGDAMVKLGKFDEAVEYQWRTAVAFLKSNPGAAQVARNAVVQHYAVRKPNHEQLMKFYVEASGFDGHGRKTDKPEEDARYWNTVMSTAFNSKGENRADVCSYWASKFGDRFTDNDDLRKLLADLHLVSEKDKEAWIARLEKQYKSKEKSMDRVLQWCGYFKHDPEYRSEFFTRESQSLLGSLKTDEKVNLVSRLRHPLGMHEEAQIIIRGISTNGMDDEALVKLAGLVANYEPEETVLRYFAKMKDKLAATKARFDYYNSRSHRNKPYMEKALAEIPELKKSPKYAGVNLTWAEATLLRGLGRYEEAIKAYNSANKQPDSTWAVADCLVALKNYPKAIQTVRELESVGGGTASRAALQIANIHKTSGDKSREVDQLRLVLKRYPKSTESSEAHDRLESYGVALIGGESEAVE